MDSLDSTDFDFCAALDQAPRLRRPRRSNICRLTLALVGLTKKKIFRARYRQIAWSAFLISAALVRTAYSATLFDGTSIPERQGWSVFTSNGGEERSGPSALVSTKPSGTSEGEFSVETAGTRIHRYSYDTHSDELIATIRVKVLASTHNPYDSGFYFSLSDSGLLGDRANSIYIAPQEIGFADGLGDRHAVDASQYHEYSLLFRAGQIGVFIDQSVANILDGVAEPVLARTIAPSDSSFTPGIVGFGDDSNDGAVGPAGNSSYVLEFVRAQSLSSRPASYTKSETHRDRAPNTLSIGEPVEVSSTERQ